MENCLVFLCEESHLVRERRGYFKAFFKKIPVVCISGTQENWNAGLASLLEKQLNPILLLQPEGHPWLPTNLIDNLVPTACFNIDTYSGTTKRIKWSMLFDYAFVFHPGFDEIFQKAGHPRAICLPHAVEAELFDTMESDRIYEVGWVGRLDGKEYSVRRRCLAELSTRFQMNDIYRFYKPEDMRTIYKQSKIVVNLSRDDYLQDANLRCFEAMAAGALLITKKPTELSALGFVEGTHYVAFKEEQEIYEIIKFYLENEAKTRAIAQAGRMLVMQEHTYDNRVEKILNILNKDKGKLFAPAREWNKAQIQATYIHYYAKHLMIDASLQGLKSLNRISRVMAWRMIPLILKAFIRSLQLAL